MKQINNNLRFIICPLCGNSEIFKVGNINYFQPLCYSTEPVTMLCTPELWRCKICNSGFVQNIVPEADSIILYQEGKSAERFGTGYSDEPKTKEVARILRQFLSAGTKMLDIGCNTGDILDFAKNRGCKTFGLEYSLESLNILKHKGHKAYANMQEINNSFDVITAFDLVEHLYDLPSFLESCLKFLTPNGYLILLTGNINCIWAKITKANWWYLRYPEHIIFPSKKYFENYSRLRLENWIPTYADRAYDRPKHLVAISTFKRVLLRDYSGLPALSPDHALIILKHQKSL